VQLSLCRAEVSVELSAICEPGGEDVKPAADFSERGAEHGHAGAEVSIGRPIAPEFCIESPASSGALSIIAEPSVEGAKPVEQ
jgi:hypothetical protein